MTLAIQQLQMARLSKSQKRTLMEPYVRNALAWWTGFAQDLDGYAQIHCHVILDSELSITEAYFDPWALCSTQERCRDLACWADQYMQDDLTYFLFPSESLLDPTHRSRPSLERLTYILRRFHGDAYEQLLPRAKKLSAESSPPGLLTDLPSHLHAELSSIPDGEITPDQFLHAIEIKEQLERHLFGEVLPKHRASLEALGITGDDLTRQCEAMHDNLSEAIKRYARAYNLE